MAIKMDFSAAKECYKDLKKERLHLWGESLAVGRLEHILGQVAEDQGQVAAQEEHTLEALNIFLRLAPRSHLTAASLNNLGVAANRRGHPDTARQYYERALEIGRQIQSPEDIARGLGNLSGILRAEGDWRRAQEYLERELSLLEEIAPESLSFASCLHNLGTVFLERGDFDAAEGFLQRALAIKQRLDPESFSVAKTLETLGSIAEARRDYETARDLDLRTLQIRHKLDPGGLEEASSLINLGVTAEKEGKLPEAEKYIREALVIRERHAPGGLLVAQGFNNLGWVEFYRGRLDRAKDYFLKALAIRERLTPHGAETAKTMGGLGEVELARGSLDAAEKIFLRELEIETSIAPGSAQQAETLRSLGMVYQKRGLNEKAMQFLARAIESLEKHFLLVGGLPESRAGLMKDYRSYYRDLMGLLLQARDGKAAFHILERSRAHVFLATLSERDLIFADIPAPLDAAAQELAIRFDKVQEELSGVSEAGEERRDVLVKEMNDISRRRIEVINEIRRQSPRVASLRYPTPLRQEEVQKILDPGTVMLSYSVKDEKSHLFVLSAAGGLDVHGLNLGARELRAKIEMFRDLLAEVTPGHGALSARQAALHRVARELYATLIQPAAGRIEAGSRILIIPDGPLHVLPWNALVREDVRSGKDSGSGRDWEYLMEWRPLHLALSATVYEEIRRSRRSPGEASPNLAVFGDPDYPQGLAGRGADPAGATDVRVRAAERRGFRFEPLPWSRIEAEKIAHLFPADRVKLHVGAEATEEAAKSIDEKTDLVHFAAHAILDEHFPLHSAVALTLPIPFVEGRDNGLLQAWEIFEHLRLDADLVVLSACESGLGKEMGGEGLIGLTRAFQYAGARSVMASLWKISDRTTAELMIRFYRHLGEGKPRDEALRAAQMELLRGPVPLTNKQGEIEEVDASAPFYWAAFQIYGDWR